LTCCSKKGWAAEISSKKGVNRKEQCLLMSIKTLLLTIITAGEAVAPASSHFLSSHQVPEHA
jgi:predicted lysophospholipase L1 biosynthesis ABC-type transport system permease subunit